MVKITPIKFSSLINTMPEHDGYYGSDNWITNERNYLDIIEPLKKNDIKGGAYIGVGPNQNFTFIETIKPDIAFIIDIRQQMIMQHLVYKILFELAKSREMFFSLLFSKPIPANGKLKNNTDINEIVDLFYKIEPDRKMLQETTLKIISIIKNKFKIISAQNHTQYIAKIMRTFCDANLDITYDMNERKRGYASLAEILKCTDKNSEQLNLFNCQKKYNFIRKMQLNNRIIPINGDFADSRTLNNISNFLKQYDMTVSAVYVSSVEYWLFKNSKYNNWVENVACLPTHNKSVILRQNVYKLKVGYGYKFQMQYVDDFIKCNDNSIVNQYDDLLNLEYLN